MPGEAPRVTARGTARGTAPRTAGSLGSAREQMA